MKFQKNRKYYIVAIAFIIVIVLIYVFMIGRHEKQILNSTERAWLEELNSLVYVADNNAPPLRYVDKTDGQYKGVVIDYVNMLSIILGVKIDVRPMLWEDALERLSNGEADMCDMFRSEKREEHFVFTDSFYNLRGVVVVNRDLESNRKIDDLHFATQEGDYVNEYLISEYPGIKITYVANVANALKLLDSGEVDAVAGDEPVVFYQLDKLSLNDKLRVVNEPLYENEVVFSIPKAKKELLPILNKGIAEIKKSDSMEQIQQKWFGLSVPIVQPTKHETIIRYFLISGALLFLVIVSMITWNFLLKREVNKRTKEVVNTKDRLQITFDGMTEHIIVTDWDLKIVNVNKAFRNYVGDEKKKIINSHCRGVFGKERIETIEGLIHSIIETGEPQVKEFTYANSYNVIRVYPLNDIAGEFKNILLVIQDMTKEKLAEHKLLHETKMAAIGQLAAGMAHEIRNPLGIIRNQSFILESKLEEERTLRSITLINSAIERASRIVDNLLDFSRLTDDTMVNLNLYELINKILLLENKVFMKKNITWYLDCDLDLEIYSNTESLKHIVINLISNAIDAIGEEGIININVKRQISDVFIRVEDSGSGVTEEEIDKIFNPFYTTKDPDKGTGLGLYIIYTEVKKLNGEITVSSEKDENTVFEVRLPIEKEYI